MHIIITFSKLLELVFSEISDEVKRSGAPRGAGLQLHWNKDVGVGDVSVLADLVVSISLSLCACSA